MDNEDYVYDKSNREKRLTPKTGTPHWCSCCDKDLVHSGCKCDTCGTLNGIQRLKKDT
jgi:hypothetical protein